MNERAGEGGPAAPFEARIADAEITTLFAPLAGFASIGLAVSGGGDSLALLHLYARWRSLLETAPAALVLTVDHALRPESSEEARFVAAEAAALGLDHETLVWEGEKPLTGLQAAARDARYRLMGERLSRRPQPVALVTAHTRDDQAETLLMRLARGSGVDGLAGMAPRSPLPGSPGVHIVRPLLAIEGSRLRAMLTAQGRSYIEDPTNTNLDNERPRFRAARAQFDAVGLTSAAISRTAGRLQRAQAALRWAVRALADRAMTETPGLAATLSSTAFDAAPLDLRIRLLGAILARLGGSHPRARLLEIERLAERLAEGPAAVTLGGCQILMQQGSITVFREAGRSGVPEVTLDRGQAVIFDGRFEVAIAPEAPIRAGARLTIRAPRAAEWPHLRAEAGLPAGLPQAAAMTVPVAAFTGLSGETGVAAPVLGGAPTGGQAQWFRARGIHIFESA